MAPPEPLLYVLMPELYIPAACNVVHKCLLLHIHIRFFPFVLYVVIGGSVERFSNIGESVVLTTVCAQFVVRSTEL